MELPDTLIRLIQHDTKECINIVTNESIYPISQSLAAAISPLFFEAIKANPMLKEISLPVNENIEAFFQGKSINTKLFLKMSIILKNQDLINMWKRENPLNNRNAMDHLVKLYKYGGRIENMEEEIAFIGRNFESMNEKYDFSKIPNEIFSEIMRKAKGIESEEIIYHYIIGRLKREEDEDARRKLIQSIELKGLKWKEIQELLGNIKYEELTEALFSIIKDEICRVEKEPLVSKSDLPIFNFQKQKKDDISMSKFKSEFLKSKNYQIDPKGFQQLHFAAKQNYYRIGQQLISNGANIDVVDSYKLILLKTIKS